MLASLLLCASLLGSKAPANAQWTIHCDQPTVEVSPDLYGIFFEEINCAGDGGLYAELVRNRGFEDADRPEHWTGSANARLALDDSKPLSAQSPHSLKVTSVPGTFSPSVTNGGYWGMSVEQGKSYKFSLYSRVADGRAGTATVTLVGKDDKTLASAQVKLGADDWKKSETTLRATGTDPKARLVVTFDHAQVWIDMVSLFPADTWKKRANGLRTDLAEKLNALQPSFMRFPGGCWVEGETMATSLRWKQTINGLADRRTQPNIWRYMSTNGLGYHEYLQLCEDLNAAPLFVINVGMSHREVVPLDKMDEFVQDAVDAVEYANGPVTSKWGALRAKNGHPKPFNLKYLEIGNENGGPRYEERYALIYKAVKAKYPEIKTIADVWGGYPQKSPVEIIDEHYYNTPDFFIRNANMYDKYDRKGPQIYVGEYAVTIGCGQGNLIAALGEAAFMTGMERNSDIVKMSSYAPLFANVNIKAWNPDLICFDSSQSYGTPSYYNQVLFSRNKPSYVLKTELKSAPMPRAKFPDGGIAVGTWNTQSEFKDIKVVQDGKTLFESADGSALKPSLGTWKVQDGALRQTGTEEPSQAYAGDASWRNYTLTLKARKISGVEGFLVLVGRRSNGDFIWWNIGGWGNTQGALEMGIGDGKSVMGRQVRSTIETGRWYDLKVEYSQERIRCYQDGKLVYDEEMPVLNPLHVTAGVDRKTGDLILKVVNVGKEESTVDIDLTGLKKNPGAGTVTVLTSGDPLDENSLNQPTKIAPKQNSFAVRGNNISRTFPAYSVSVIRLVGAK